jgi:hypothetical protein
LSFAAKMPGGCAASDVSAGCSTAASNAGTGAGGNGGRRSMR